MGPTSSRNRTRCRSPSGLPTWRRRRRKLEAAGVSFATTIDSGVCLIADFKDPDGNALMLHHRYAPYPDGSTP